jgi:hypothetical protein
MTETLKPIADKGCTAKLWDQASLRYFLTDETLEVYKETNLTPRQLLEQRDELITELQRITYTLEAYMKDAGDQDCFEGTTGDARSLIAKCGKVGGE